MQISVIGTGYVGLVSGTCLAEIGHEVICVDIDAEKIKKLKQGQIPIYEPGLQELVERNFREGRLKFTTSLKDGIQKSEVLLSAVGTPPDKDHKADLSAVFSVAKSVGKYINGYKVFVNKSTVPVGTSKKVKDIISETSKGKHKFDVVDNPEFLREGCAVKDFMNPDRIVCGVSSKSAKEVMNKVYDPIVRAGRPLIFTDLHSAEIIKYASNSFLATKISFINEVASFCELVGADIKEVAKGIGLDQRIGPRFLHAGIGYGGSCFPKDVQAFIQTGEEKGYQFQILKAVEEVNKKQKISIFQKLKKEIPSLKGKKVAIWGLSFKPKTDDMREAPSIPIIQSLLDEEADIYAFDPVAIKNAKKVLGTKGITYEKNPYDATKNADALIILTEWDEFRAVDLGRLKSLMKGNYIFDGRNIYSRKSVKDAGFKYICIGR